MFLFSPNFLGIHAKEYLVYMSEEILQKVGADVQIFP